MEAAVRARFDKEGRPLPETGHGCGCQLCADANAPRYERRDQPERSGGRWHPALRWAIVFWRNKKGLAAMARPTVE
jgi:hypothetical protein